MYTTNNDPKLGVEVFRAVVVRSNSSTGELYVKIPEILGKDESLPITKDFLVHHNGKWRVPPEGAQVLVGLDGPRARVTYLIADLSTVNVVESNYGSFYSTVTQTAASVHVPQAMTLNTTDIAKGISITNNSRITFEKDGVYDIQFSSQFLHSTGNEKLVNIWISKNGSSIPNTNTRLNIPNGDYLVAAWDFIVEVTAGQYVEIMWETDNTNITMRADPLSGDIPATPSVIVTVMQINTVSTVLDSLAFVN